MIKSSFNRFLVLLVGLLTMCVTQMWGAEVTYTWTYSSSKFNVSSSGTTPDGSSASLTSTYSSANQLTGGKTQTFTLSGYDGCTITGISIIMKRSSSTSAKANITVSANGEQIGSSSNLKLTQSQADYPVDITSTKVGNGQKVVITVNAAANSIYVYNYKVTYTTDSATITLSEAGEESNVSGTHYVGDSYTLPSTTSASCGSKVLVGWSTVQIPTPDAKPVNNYYEKGSSVTLAAKNKFYAVFADASAGSGASGSVTITHNSTNFPTAYADATSYSLEGYDFNLAQIYKNGKMQWKASTGIMYNESKFPGSISSIVVTYNSSDTKKNLVVKVGSSANPSDGASITPSIDNLVYTFDCSSGAYDYFYIINGVNAGYTDQIVIYYAPGTTYSNYTTTCGPATYTASVVSPAPSNGSIKLSTSENGSYGDGPLENLNTEDWVYFTVTPSLGYQITSNSVKVNNSTDGIKSLDSNKYKYQIGTASITISAAFELIPATTLTFDANGGTVTPTSTTDSPATLPTPTKTGYNFAGWCENSNLSDASPKNAGSSYSFSESKTLYAKWTPKTYTITLDMNGGSTDGSATATFNSGALTEYTAATRSAGTYKWTLDGYYTSKTGGGDVKVIDNEGHLVANISGYTDGSGNWTKDDDATLYARWTKIFIITWRTATGSTTTEVVEGNNLVLPAEDPVSCDGETYTTFIGWYDTQHGTADTPSGSLSGNKATAETTPDNNKTYYAVWADGAAEGSNTWVEITSAPDAGTYAILTDSYFMKAEVSNNRFTNGSATPSITDGELSEEPADDCQWILSKPDTCYRIQNGTNYAGGTNSKNQGALLTDASADLAKWSISYETDHFEIVNYGRSQATSDNDKKYLRNNTTYGWATYGFDIGSAPRLFKKNTVVGATGFISTCCSSPAVVTVTPTSTNLALNLDGTASTSVHVEQSGAGAGKYYAPTVTPSATGSTDWAGSWKTGAYDVTFTATAAGTYTIKGNFTETAAGCAKYGSTQISVAANPILEASVANLTVNGVCGQAGAASSFTINSRYLTSAAVTVAASTTSGSGAYKVSKNGTDYSTSVTFDGGTTEKGTQTIYVRYEGIADESGAIAGNIAITGGGAAAQNVALSGTCSCDTYIQISTVDFNSTNVMAVNGQWTRTLKAISLRGAYLLNHAAAVTINVTSSNSNFKLTDSSTLGSRGQGSLNYTNITSTTWDKDIYVVYTPNSYGADETTTLTVKVVTYGGTTVHATETIDVTGKSLPEEFVIAVNTGSQWVAVPADMIAPFGGSAGQCTTGVGTHDPYVISVDNAANPTKATTVPARAVYKGYARNSPTTQPWASQFVSKSQAGYYLWGSASVADANEGASADLTTIANQNYATSERTKWTLETTDGVNYQLHINPTLNDNKLGYNGTADRIGQYKNGASPYKYNFRFLPFDVEPCTYYVKPTMELTAFTNANATVTIPFDGTTAYQISTDNKANWTDINGVAGCKNLNFTLPLNTYRDADIWLKPQGSLCQDATSETSLHILNPTITADASKEFNGVQNVAFNGEFAITTSDIWTGAGGGVQVASSNPAITATYNGTTEKVELSMAAVPAGDYSTTLTLSSVGASNKTVNVTIHVLSLATMNLTVTNANNGLVCNAAATITTSKFYTGAGVAYTTPWGGTGTYTLYNLSDGTSITSGLTGAISEGVVTITVPTAKMTVGNRYQLGWTNTANLTDATGLKYADAVSEEFVFSENCSAPTLLAPCILSPTSVNMQWVGDCDAANSTVSVYTKQTQDLYTNSLKSGGSVSWYQWKNYQTASAYYNKWMYYCKAGEWTAPTATYGPFINKVSTNIYIYTPQVGSSVFDWGGMSLTAETEFEITVQVYCYNNAKSLRCFVVNGEPTNTTGTTEDNGADVYWNGSTVTSKSYVSETVTSDNFAKDYQLKSFTVRGLSSSSRLAFCVGSYASSSGLYVQKVSIKAVKKGTPVDNNVSCSAGEKAVSGLTANTTYYATITNNGKTSNEVSFKTYDTGDKSLTFKDGETPVTEVMVLGGAGQEKTITIEGTKLAGCDISTNISAGYSVDESGLSFDHATGALSGSVVITLTDPGVSEGTYTITDGAGKSYTLNLTSTNCPAGFNTMATAATDILTNSATANWTNSVTSGAGHVVLYKNGIVNRELIENGGFETGDLTGWNDYDVGAGYSCDAYDIASTNTHSGSKCLAVTEKGASGFAGLEGYSVLYAHHTIFEAGTYRFTAWVKVKNETGEENKDDFVLAFTGGIWDGNRSQPQTVFAKSAARTVMASEGYVQLTADLTLTRSQNCHPVIAVNGTTGTFRDFWLDDVSLKRISAPMGDEPDMNLEVANLSAGSLVLNGLSGNTEYAYKITNEDGCESNIITFHTLAAGEPVITVTSPATISAPLGSSSTGVSVVGAVDAFDNIIITKTGDDAGRFTLSRTTLPMEGGVLHYTFTPKNTDSPGDQGSITITFSTRGLSTPTELVVNWTITSGIDINTEMIEVTDVANDQITIETNVEGVGPHPADVRVVFNRELDPGEVTANVGDEVFFSKYYEAYMHKKLWAIYNPTDHDISLEGMQVWRSKGDYSDWNTEHGIDLSSMGKTPGVIGSNEEIIVYTADQVGSCEESQVDMSDWVGMSSKDQALSFSGDDALLLVRKVGSGDTLPATDQAGNSLSWRQYTDGERQRWHMLDIIGARKDDNTPDGSAIVNKWSWTNNNSVVEQGDDKGWVGCGYDMNNSNAYTQDANCHGYLLSTNRCLLVRRKDVKSGNNAVAVNIGDMATLSSEWQGAHVPTSGDQAAVSCENFAFVGGYDYEGYYNHYTPLDPEDDYEYLNKNSDGSYSFAFDVPAYYCKNLRIEVVETQNLDGMEVDNIHAFTDYKVPIVIDTNKSTTDAIFTDLTSSVCNECDVVVRNTAKLSHVSGGQGQFRDMYVYPGAKLDNSNKQAISLRTIYMQSRNDEVGYAIINDGQSSLSAENIVHTKRVDDQYWYTFSLPYDCDIAAIRQVNGKTMGIYEDDGNYGTGDWTIQYYDGAARQEAGTSAAAGENSVFWKSVPANGTLKAHQAYAIGLYTTEWTGQLKNVYFPPKTGTEYTETGDAAKTTTVTNWAENLASEARHHGWNFVGSPYISMFNETSDGQGLNNGSVVMKGRIDGAEYTDTEHVYVSIPDGGNSKTYTQVLASATKLKPFSGYFVQVVDPTSGSSEEKILTYAKGNRTLSAPARAAATRQKVMVELSIAASNGLVDNAGVLVDDRYTTAYELGHDLTKLYAQGTKPQLYSIAANGEKMAYIALPDEAAYEVPIGIYAPQTGNYVLSMNEQVSRIAGAESVELLYQGQVVANLMIEDYTIAAQKGTVSGYSVRIQRIAQIATSTDLIDGESIKAIVNNGKITVENLPEDATVMLYDMVGKMLMSTGTNGYNLVNLDVPAQGVYNISVRSSKGNATIKTIVR